MKKTKLILLSALMASTLQAGDFIGVGGIMPTNETQNTNSKKTNEMLQWDIGLNYSHIIPSIINSDTGNQIKSFDKEGLIGVKAGILLDNNHRFTIGHNWGDDGKNISLKTYNANYDYLIGNSTMVKPFVGIGATYLQYTIENPSSYDKFNATSINANGGVRITLGERTQVEVGYKYGLQTSGDDTMLIEGQSQQIELDKFSALYFNFGVNF